jgi:mannobiose 2-epimerase
LRELIDLFSQRILDPQAAHLHHFFNAQWQVRSDTYTFGHDIEASWLLCEAAEVLGDPALTAKVRSLALRMAGTTLREALGADGGLDYEGQGGRIIDDSRECWVQAEAVVGFLNACQLSGDLKYFTAAQRTWRFIQDHLVDRAHGEWFWRVKGGHPVLDLPKVSEWKGPYHASRMCLETLRRLRILNLSTKPLP